MIRVISLALTALLISSLTYVAWQYYQFMHTPLSNQQSIQLSVKPGSNLKELSESLTQKGLTTFPPLYLQLYGRYTKQANRIKAGDYQIEPNTTLPELLDKLVTGKTIEYSFTIIDGMTIKQVLKLLDDDPNIKATVASPKALMSGLGKPKTAAEGWFLPDTYYFSKGTTDVVFLNRAYKAMQSELNALWKTRAKGLPYKTPYDALIMASLIEKETAAPEERAIIAGVFVRRLKIGMRLQTDPTVIYGMGDKYKGNIRKKDLQTDTPYNTYTRYGLPPTPICLPNKASIEAALHPADGKSLYFVATGKDGKHYFSATLKEHNAAVRRYQLKKK